MNSTRPWALAIHGGAGTITRSAMTPERETAYRSALDESLRAGNTVLSVGGKALDAVAAALVSLENCPLFNAGRGAVYTHDGTHEMDAAIMEGQFRKAGAVAGVAGIKNPVLLAKAVMEHSEHVLLAGRGAEEFARSLQFEFEDPTYFHDELRWNQWQSALLEGRMQLDHTEDPEKKFGTVGAVALDQHGHLAAATSTGGMTNKRWGRVGDSPVIGAGTYASDATCAISCTGHGEFFLRAVVAYDIACLIEYKGLSLQEACRIVVHDKLVPFGGEGGLIAVDAKGNIALPFNSEGMYRGWSKLGVRETGIYGDEMLIC